MTEHRIMEKVRAEIIRANVKHPNWPQDPLHAFAIVQEEIGELQREVLQHTYQEDKTDEIKAEAIQCIAMLFEFLCHMDSYLPLAAVQIEKRRYSGCAECDRGDWQFGHSEFCPKSPDYVYKAKGGNK